VELSGEKGTGASDEPRPGGFRSCTEELDSSGRMDGVRRSGAIDGCPLNKGGPTLLLAKRINRERHSSSGEGPATITSGWESGWGVRGATGSVRHRLVVGKAASTRDETTTRWRGVGTHAALFGVPSEGTSLPSRSKLARANSPVDLRAIATHANGSSGDPDEMPGTRRGATNQKSTR